MRRRLPDAAIILFLLALPLLWFAPQALGHATLLPADNLYAFPPWQAFAQELGVGEPHNALVSDLILENYAWKSFIVDALRSGELTDLLWNPRTFAGAPFFAAGQHSALYPLSVLFYILPLARAYGVFTWLQLGIAAAGMYVLARVLGMRRPGATIAAVAYAFSGFYIVSVNFTMIIAAAAWLPLILAVIEVIVRKQEEKGDAPYSPAPYVVLGAVFLGLEVLAGHVEITYYTLLVAAFYAAWRLISLRRPFDFARRGRPGAPKPAPRIGAGRIARLAGWLVVMVVLGLALGAIQLIPMYELATQSFREGSASLQQVRDWAWPSRQIVTFLLPDFFGNPTHHAYFDIWQRAWTPVTHNALGAPLATIDWGVKNYVEGASYLGIVTLLLAALGVGGALRRTPGSPSRRRLHVALFGALAVLSLLFAFGTPLYALLFHGLPGYSQLHSAFRWVFPYTLSMAILAGFGCDRLLTAGRDAPAADPPGAAAASLPAGRAGSRGAGPRVLGWLAVGAGLGVLLVVAASIAWPAPFVALGDRLLAWSDLARARGFADGAMAWSYEATGLARLGLMALLAGLALLWVHREQRRGTRRRTTPAAAALLAVLILDLWLFGRAFNPASDPGLLDRTPPVVAWLQAHADEEQPWRLTTFDAPGEKTLNANASMPYGLEDVRGYDSIIPRTYARFMARIQPQADLLYNRIGPVYTEVDGRPGADALDSRLLDLLGVRYVVTTHAIPNAGYALAYDGEVRVYENLDALPRVFIAPEAVAAPDADAALDLLESVDPARTVVVEGIAAAQGRGDACVAPTVCEARIARRTNRELFVDVNIGSPGWLVLTDNYFEGWKAYLRPFGAEGEGVDEAGSPIEQQLTIHRADGAFRAVHLPEAGQWTVRFVYSPRSLLLGAYASFLAGITLLLLCGWWAWGRYYRGERTGVGTVAKNSAVQVSLSLLNKGIDFAFAMLRMRVLSPVGEGSYAFVIAFYGVFEIITRFGMGTLVTRDVACQRGQARRYLRNVVALRSGLWLISLPLMALLALVYRAFFVPLGAQELLAIAIFAGVLFFANIADAITSVFNAYEKMEYPAGAATAIAVAKIALGALVILPPLDRGFVGLAAVSLVTNIVQVVWLYLLLERKVLAREVRPPRRLEPTLQRYMLRESGPLMVNHLLATMFWRISQFVLRAAAAPAALGIFSAGVKYLDGINVIPSYFTLAIFPLMSRYARSGNEALVAAYRLAVQLLFMIALPVAVLVTFLATPLIRILGGAAYLPGSAIVLSIMIWSIPIGFVNSVTQYALIAVGRQRTLTGAFVIGLAVAAVTNLLLVPRYGFIAAAALLIPAELALFVPFAVAVHRHLAHISWPALLGRPLIAAALDVALAWGLQRAGLPVLVALAAGLLAYLVVLWALGSFRGDEFAPLRGYLRGLSKGVTAAARPQPPQ